MASNIKGIRNPFGVADVPDPFDQTVSEFVDRARLEGAPTDVNAPAWCRSTPSGDEPLIDGEWSSHCEWRSDPTVPTTRPSSGNKGAHR